MRSRAAFSLALLVAFGGSCGYHAGLLVPDHARTVGVEVFSNGSPLRNLEVEVTSEVARSVADLVSMTLVPPDEADVVIRGVIGDYRRRSGVRDADNRPLETAVSITIQADLVRRSSGAVIRSSVASVPSGFVVEDGVIADDTPEETQARARAIANLADKLVLDLFTPASDAADG